MSWSKVHVFSLVSRMAKHVFVRKTTPQPQVIFDIYTVLVAISWLVFGQTLRQQFVTYDHRQYFFRTDPAWYSTRQSF